MDEPVNLKEFSVSIKTEAELKEGASHIVSILRPQWKKENHKYKFFSDGITNKLIGVYVDPDKTDMVLIRVYGTKSELLIDRQAEIRNIKLMTETGLGGKLYATFSNGLAYQYVHGDVMTNDVVKNPEVYPVVAATVAKMHRVASKGHEKAEPCLWIKMRQFFDLSPDEFPNDADQNARYKASNFSKAEREAEMVELQGLLENSGNPVVFCHNDLVLANIILQPGNKVSFIDFEYGDFNYQAFDIADHFCEFAGVSSEKLDYAKYYPDKEYQVKWLRAYLQAFHEVEEVNPQEIESLYKVVNKFALCARMFWGNWALVQAQISTIDFDFLGYAILMFDEYKRRKPEFINL